MKELPMADPVPPFARIAIVGCGLIGGSLGLAIKERWPRALVIAIDRKDVIEIAMRRQAADVGGDDLILAAEADLVVLAAPVRVNNRVLAELASHIPGAAVVTDVGSTKRETVAASRALPPRLRFIGGHPLAGAAMGGIGAARADLFQRRPWILTPAGQGDQAAVEFGAMLGAIGTEVRLLTPEAHDRLLAYLSHLPQLAVSALMEVVGNEAGDEGLGLAGRGLRDTTRLASSPAAIWRDILNTNRDEIGPAIDALIATLRRLQHDATGDDLTRTFDSAGEWKRALERGLEDPS